MLQSQWAPTRLHETVVSPIVIGSGSMFLIVVWICVQAAASSVAIWKASVAQAVVIARPDASGALRLLAYVTAEPGGTAPDPDLLRDALRRRLPEHMVPAVIVALDAMPLTPNGKVDRKRLPEPDVEWSSGSTYVPPATATQEVLAGIWADVLGRDGIGIRDNFFRAGGHSLLATQVISRVREALHIDAPVRELFEAPTIDEFSRALVRREARPGQTERIAAIFKKVCAMGGQTETVRP